MKPRTDEPGRVPADGGMGDGEEGEEGGEGGTSEAKNGPEKDVRGSSGGRGRGRPREGVKHQESS